jgi:pimeloyl-ACP methyl ester carboxylesterase
VLHPYGRYCNGSRFAGETDFFEALEIVQRDYRIDDERMVVRGFSLGGAACWHIAAHHAWRWCAAAPGAGFSETEEFLNFFQGETLKPAPWERKLWALYDATAVAANFFNLPVVAYSGETDRQKQAADAMARAMEKEGMTLTHIIGPEDSARLRAREPKPKSTGASTPWPRRVGVRACTAPGPPPP